MPLKSITTTYILTFSNGPVDSRASKVYLLNATQQQKITFFGLETAQVDTLEYPKVPTLFKMQLSAVGKSNFTHG